MEFVNLRKVFFEELIKFAKKNDKIISIDADSKKATLSEIFTKEFPNRSFSTGIAEQNMVTVAGGMSTMGLIPIVSTYTQFIAMRALDQVRNSVAYPNLNVKFVLSHHGLDVGSDGVTHQTTEDISIFRSIPNLKLLQPADKIEVQKMMKFFLETKGPIIMKVGKSLVPKVFNQTYNWKYGIPNIVEEGEKVAIVAVGNMVQRAINARKIIKKKLGWNTKIINMSSLTDVKSIEFLKLIKNIDLIITLEDHSIYGGLGSIVCEILGEHKPTKVIRIGLKRNFAESGSTDQLHKKYNMDESEVVKQIIKHYE